MLASRTPTASAEHSAVMGIPWTHAKSSVNQTTIALPSTIMVTKIQSVVGAIHSTRHAPTLPDGEASLTSGLGLKQR